MTPQEHFSRPCQLRREWYWLWRRIGVPGILLGLVYGLAGFYAFHPVGASQVYDVRLPFVLLSVYLMMKVFTCLAPQVKTKTAVFHAGLPRDRQCWVDAHLVAFLALCAAFEIAIFLGVALKLGGAGITPHYRIQPEYVVLPFLCVLTALWFYLTSPSTYRRVQALCAAAVLLAWFMFKLSSRNLPDEANNYLPERAVPLIFPCLVAALMAAIGGYLVWDARRGTHSKGV